MQVFLYLGILVAVAIAIFAVQNSSAPLVTIKFLFWEFETSLVYTILGSILAGVIMTGFLWITHIFRRKAQKKQPEVSRT